MQVRADVAAAACVEGEPRRTTRCRVVAVAPLDQHEQHRPELAALFGEDVLGPARAVWVGDALEHPFVAQQLQSVGEDVRRDPQALLELLEPLKTDHGRNVR